MRISDWSSDVCSSDLRIDSAKTVLYAGIDADLTPELTAYLHGGYERYRRTSFDGIPTLPDGSPAPVGRSFFIGSGDLVGKSVVSGTSVAVRVDLGGRRSIIKKR